MTFRTSVYLPLFLFPFALVGCGGGGGSNDSGAGDSGGASGDVVLTGTWEAHAEVLSDTCHDRISDVNQRFFFDSNGDVNTGIMTLPVTAVSGGGTFGFSDQSGDCKHSYSGTFTEPSGGVSTVALSSTTTCPTITCSSEWSGTASQISATSELVDDNASFAKVSGENCTQNVPQEVGYRPSLYECNGNAAVLMRGNLRNNFSVVVRIIGGSNDRDPANPSCGTNQCSPFKTQKKIELSSQQVNCLGDDGFSSIYGQVTRISVKYAGLILNKNDPHQFEQYCLNSRTSSLH